MSPRSELLAKALNVKIWFFPDNVTYIRAFVQTLRRALNQKPKTIIIQLPQGPLLLAALLLKRLTKCKIVADVHTGFLVNTSWKGFILNLPFVRLLHSADLVTAHNEFQLSVTPQKIKSKTMVLFTPWQLISDGEANPENNQRDYIVFPASFASDEPLKEVIEAIKKFDINVQMYVTGNWNRLKGVARYSSKRILFTGYLPNEQFNYLISRANAIITGTKREYTALMSGWEALAYNKPLALTETATLRSLFGGYAVFYDWRNSKSIAEAIQKIQALKPTKSVREKLKFRSLKTLEIFKNKLSELIGKHIPTP